LTTLTNNWQRYRLRRVARLLQGSGPLWKVAYCLAYSEAFERKGATECLERQNKTLMVAEIRSQFNTVALRADVAVDRSCFCRLNVTEQGK